MIRIIKKLQIRDGNGEIYMVRYSSPLIPGLKLHRFLRSDNDCLHDHPWAFISFIIWGSYIEETITEEVQVITKFKMDSVSWTPENRMAVSGKIEGQETQYKTKQTYYSFPNILYRRATHRHRILITKPCWTLVITFKKVRDWGFWTKDGWVQWLQYLKTFGGKTPC